MYADDPHTWASSANHFSLVPGRIHKSFLGFDQYIDGRGGTQELKILTCEANIFTEDVVNSPLIIACQEFSMSVPVPAPPTIDHLVR